MEETDRVGMLNKAIQDLDPEDQLLVLLRFEHGMRAQQIAKVMQFENHKYVYTRLRTIINRLRPRSLRILLRDTLAGPAYVPFGTSRSV